MPTRTEACEIAWKVDLIPDTSLKYAQATVDMWKIIAPIVRERKYQHDGFDIKVQVNWEPIHLLLAEELRNSLDQFSEPPPGYVKKNMFVCLSPEEAQDANANREKSISAYITVSGPNELSDYSWNPDFFVETYLHDLFLMLNLALPGSTDFFNIKIRKTNHSTDTLRLSSYSWWPAYQETDQWPLLNTINPGVVAEWYYSIRRGFAQIPESAVERAMFAMLHVCKSDGRPEDMIWLFYGFESLFQTRAGENFSALVDRLILILQPNNEQEKQLRKQMREMYDFRSSFVHGGLSVIHPMHNEKMDKGIEKQYRKIIDLSKYGSRLLLACLQRYVQNGWQEVHYRTIAEPIRGEF